MSQVRGRAAAGCGGEACALAEGGCLTACLTSELSRIARIWGVGRGVRR